MKRRWIDLRLLLSVLACLVAVTAFVASYFNAGWIIYNHHQQWFTLAIGRGVICFDAAGTRHDAVDSGEDVAFNTSSTSDFRDWQDDHRSNAIHWQLLGFEWAHVDAEAIDPSAGLGFEYWHTLTIPFWFLIAVSVLETRWAFVSRKRRLAQITGCCIHCGYDLRATPERCPECGLVSAK